MTRLEFINILRNLSTSIARWSTLVRVFQKVDELDLSAVAATVASNGVWPPQELSRYEHLYRRFLVLCVCYSDQTIVPTKELDEWWHAHILHTRDYHNDCFRIAGHYIHHTPHRIGKHSPLEAKSTSPFKLADSRHPMNREFIETKKLFVDTFGIDLDRESRGAYCGLGCDD